MNIREQNAIQALRLGLIDWFQFFELWRASQTDGYSGDDFPRGAA